MRRCAPMAQLSKRPTACKNFPTVISDALLAEELEALAASRSFRHSARHLRFLRYLVEHTRRGDFGALREKVLASAVFFRNAERFDAARDTIVRVEARRLRQRLAEYYAGDGALARLRITLPPGRYALEFQRPPRLAEAPRRSLAQTTLRNEAGAEHDALVNGLNGELAGALMRVQGLRLVAGDSAARWDAAAVDHVLQGALRRDGDRFELAVELLRTADREPLLRRQERWTLGDDPARTELIVRRIVAAIQQQVQDPLLQRAPPIQLAGRLPYVRAPRNEQAREMAHRAGWWLRARSIDAVQKGIALLEEALQLGEEAAIHADLAYARVALVGFNAVPPQPTMEAARAAARRALELDAENGSAHATLGTVLHAYDRDWPAAERSLLRALRFAPGHPGVHARYGWSLMFNRRYDESHEAIAQARELAPFDPTLRTHGAQVCLYQRDFERAAAELDAVIELAPQQVAAVALRAALALYQGEPQRALAAFERLAAAYPRLSIGRCGCAQAHALLGDHAAAQAALQGLLQEVEAGRAPPYQVAMVMQRLGDPAQALQWLRRAADARDFNYVCVAVDPTFDAMRGEAGYRALLADTGLAHLLDVDAAAG